MVRTYRLRSALNIFDKVHDDESMKSHRNLYAEFCKDKKFKLDTSTLSQELWEDITNAFRTFEQIGALVYEGIIDESSIIALQANVCVRLWIVLEGYIQEERKSREYTAWAARFECLTVLCLRSILDNPSRGFAIYHPEDRSISKPDDTECLSKKLQKLEAEVKGFGWNIRKTNARNIFERIMYR